MEHKAWRTKRMLDEHMMFHVLPNGLHRTSSVGCQGNRQRVPQLTGEGHSRAWIHVGSTCRSVRPCLCGGFLFEEASKVGTCARPQCAVLYVNNVAAVIICADSCGNLVLASWGQSCCPSHRLTQSLKDVHCVFSMQFFSSMLVMHPGFHEANVGFDNLT